MAHLYKRGNVWWLKFYLNGKAYCKSLKTKDKTLAKALKNEKELALAKGQSILPLQAPISEILDKYLSFSKGRRVSKFAEEDDRRLRRFVDWSKVSKLSQVTPHLMNDYLAYYRKKKDKSPATMNHVITSIKTFLHWAVSFNYISENPLKNFKKFPLIQKKIRFLDQDEIQRLLETAQDTPFFPMVATAIYTGMRVKELLNLEWSDIDWQNRIIQVINKAGFTTKSKRHRTIPLNDKLLVILKAYRKDKGYCFFPQYSRKWPLRKSFNTLLKNAKLNNVGWHTLRHTFASQLAQAGISIYKISQWLGHKDVSTTMVYSHLAPGRDEDINKI